MKKLLILLFTIFLVNKSYSQEISCNELFDYVIQNSRPPSVIYCYNSSMLIKVLRFKVDGIGFVVAYIKQSEYDFIGKPYVYCGVSDVSWLYFQSEGLIGSWGQSFHRNIKQHKCNCY